MRTIVIFALALSLGAAPLLAQNVRPTPGDRVRIQRAGESAASIFILTDIVADTLVLRRGSMDASPSTRMVLGSIARVQVSARRRPFGARALRGAVRGFGGGALVGGIIGLASGDDPPSNWFAMTASEKAVFAGVALGSIGLLGGAIIGAASNGEQWKSVPLENIQMLRTTDGSVVVGYQLRL